MKLEPPTTRVHRSFLEAMEEFRGEGRGGAHDSTMIGAEFREFGHTWHTANGFARYLGALCGQRLEETPRPPKWVPCTTLWYTDGDEYLGRLAIRHRLTPFLVEEGGHVGYDVRPSARRRGHATEMLRRALPIARDLGLSQVLVTCDADNIASRRVIEKNGGVFEDQRGTKLRFWIS